MQFDSTEDVFSQDGDCCSSDDFHTLKLKTLDGGGGPFLIMETSRWAFNDEAEINLFVQRLKAVLRRANAMYEEDTKKDDQAKSVHPDQFTQPSGSIKTNIVEPHLPPPQRRI